MQALFEQVPRDAGESFACREFRMRRFPSPWHFHPEYELTLIVAGRGTRLVGDHIEAFVPGDLVLLGPNLPHVWTSETSRRRALSHSVVVQFKEGFGGSDLFALPELASVRSLLRRAARGLKFAPGAHPELCSELSQIPKARPGVRLHTLLSVLQGLSDSRSGRLLASASYGFDLDHAAATRMERVISHLLQRCISEPIRLDEVAAVAGMAPSAFCRYFKRHTGKSLTRFVNEVRVSHAKKLLHQTDDAVVDVCYASGYSNLSHFNRQFSRIAGMTPRTYRARTRD